MEKKIVVLGNGLEWCKYSLSDFEKNGSRVINSDFPCSSHIVEKIVCLHYANRINNLVKLPLKKIWFPYFANCISKNKNQPILLVIYDRNKLANNFEFLNYLRKSFKDIKLVYMFTNVARISGASANGCLDKLKNYYDVVYAFDPMDSVEFGFKYSPLLYSKNLIDGSTENSCVFYVGNAKDRYSQLMDFFYRLKEIGKNRNFFITGVPDNETRREEEIHYNTPIPYKKCLENIQKSTCLLDVIQGNSSGFTIKVCEAVYYNKLLITTNKHIKELPFYDERFIRVIESAYDITSDFFEYEGKVEYDKSAMEYFSIANFIKKVSNDVGDK